MSGFAIFNIDIKRRKEYKEYVETNKNNNNNAVTTGVVAKKTTKNDVSDVETTIEDIL